MTLVDGATFGAYRIERLLGRGGMGEVYLATHAVLGRHVALKLLPTDTAGDERFRQRFVHESKLAASLDHPHIVPIYEAGDIEGRLFIAMRYVEGADLAQLVERSGPLDPGRAIVLLRGVAAALDAAHDHGLVHRDVKPANVLVAAGPDGEEHAYLGDFGLVRQAGSASGLTRDGLVGSVDFIAPEQAEGRPIDGRADQYSLACVLFTALTGAPPFPRKTEMATLWAHIQQPPPSISEFRPELEGLDAVLAAGMAKDPADRYPNTRALIDAAAAAVKTGGSVTRVVVVATMAGYEDLVERKGSAVAIIAAGRFQAAARDALRDRRPLDVSGDTDRLVVIFRSTSDAIRAALAIAERLEREDDGDAPGIPARIGLHAGEVDGTREGTTAQILDVARRVAASGAPSEILATDTVRGLARGTVPAEFISRGRRRLPGQDERIELFSVRPMGDAAAAAASRGADRLPYVGLRAFDESDAAFFVGREGEIDLLLERLRRGRFVAVFGPSGSGKSSLVRAGLVPKLRSVDDPGAITIEIIRPGARPLDALAARLVAFRPGVAMGALVDELAGDERSLHHHTEIALSDRSASSRLLWVVDQAEELFTLCDEESARRAAIDNLTYAATVAGGRAVVLLAMRADFYHRCAQYPRLARLVAESQFLVSPLDADGLRRTVEEPARAVGLEFEPGLIDTILADVVARPGALPLLEHALLELWNRRDGRTLTLAGYRESGGIDGAIAVRAEATYESFDHAGKAAAQRILLRLVQPGEGTEDTRRRARMRELEVATDATATVAVVDALAAARLITVDTADGSDEPVVDLAHEALLRAWPRLRAWIDEDREGLRVTRRITAAAAEWARLGHERDALLHGARLAEATEFMRHRPEALPSGEHHFIEASIAERERAARANRRRQRLLAGVSAGLAVFFLALSGLAAVLWRQAEDAGLATTAALRDAEHARGEAVVAGDEAVVRSLIAQSLVERDRVDVSALLALEAVSRSSVSETWSNLAAAIQRRPEVRTILRAPGRVIELAVSPDGRSLAIVVEGSEPETHDLTIWSVEPWRKLAGPWPIGEQRFVTPNDAHHVAFRPDGAVVAYATGDRELRIVDTTGGTLGSVRSETRVDAIAWDVDGDLVWVGPRTASDPRATVRRWEPASGSTSATDVAARVLPDSGFADDGTFTALLSPDARYLVISDLSGLFESAAGGGARVFDATTGREVGMFTGIARGFTIAGDGIIEVGVDGLRIRSLPDLKVVGRTEPLQSGLIWATADLATGRVAVWTGGEASVAIYSLTDGRVLVPKQPGISDEPSDAIGFAENGLVFANHGPVIEVISLDAPTRLRDAVLPSHDAGDGLLGMTLSPDGSRLMRFGQLGDDRPLIKVVDTRSGKPIAEITVDGVTHPFIPTFTRDGSAIVTLGADGKLTRWDIAAGSSTALGTTTRLKANLMDAIQIAVADDGTIAVVGSADETEVVRAPDPSRALPSAQAAAFLPGSRQLVLASCERSVIEIFDVASLQLLRTFADAGCPRLVAATSDGRIVAISDNPATLVSQLDVYDRDIGHLGQVDLDGLNAYIGGLGLQSAATAVVVGDVQYGEDEGRPLYRHDVFTIDIDKESWRAKACVLAGRNLTSEERETYGAEPGTVLTCPEFPSG